MGKLNMIHKIKKHWKEPHFIVLIKGKRVEKLLLACKSVDSETGVGPAMSGCTTYIGEDIGPCSAQSPS
jgi:hypothetical protein